MSAFAPTRKSVVLDAGSDTAAWKEQAVTQEALGFSIKLRSRPGRESHHGIVLDPAQSELADAPVQREAIELRLGRVGRKDFHLPAAQVLGFWQIDQPAQLQPDFDVLCRGLVIVVEQVEDQSPTVGFPSQLTQHVTARLQAEARPSGRGFGARRNSRLRLSGPDDDAPGGGGDFRVSLRC